MSRIHPDLAAQVTQVSNPVRSKTRSIPAPIRRNNYLFFDVETTGLLPNRSEAADINKYPHILQLSFIKYDMNTQSIVDTYNSYIKIGDDVEISEYVRDLTGITREKCNSGATIIDAVTKLYEAYSWCDCLVAHNIDFDTKAIMVNIERHREQFLTDAPYCFALFNTINENMRQLERYCTMKKGTSLCNILMDRNNGRPPNPKFPKLVELYSKLFDGQVPEGMHDSMVDTMACMKCYLKMRHNIDM